MKKLRKKVMAKGPGKKTAEGGLELDKINLSGLASENARKPARIGDPGVGTENPAAGISDQKPAADNALQNKKKFNLALISFLAILALLMALTAFFKQQDFSFSFLSGESDTLFENYLRVGPVTATLANEDIVKFSIDIDCGNADLKEQLAGKDSQIRNKIVDVLTAPGTDELIKKRDYETIKAKIKENLGDLTSDDINDIYFADLLMY